MRISEQTLYDVAKDLLERADTLDASYVDCAFEAMGILRAFVAGYAAESKDRHETHLNE